MKLNYNDCFRGLCRVHIVFSVYASVDQKSIETILKYFTSKTVINIKI